jgi:hypothetical protein
LQKQSVSESKQLLTVFYFLEDLFSYNSISSFSLQKIFDDS